MEWRTSTFSSAQGNCVEVGIAKTSSYTGGVNCVEVEELPNGWVAVRDTKYAKRGEESQILVFNPEEWDAFIAGAKNNEFDRQKVDA